MDYFPPKLTIAIPKGNFEPAPANIYLFKVNNKNISVSVVSIVDTSVSVAWLWTSKMLAGTTVLNRTMLTFGIYEGTIMQIWKSSWMFVFV